MHFCKICQNMYYIRLSGENNNTLTYYCLRANESKRVRRKCQKLVHIKKNPFRSLEKLL